MISSSPISTKTPSTNQLRRYRSRNLILHLSIPSYRPARLYSELCLIIQKKLPNKNPLKLPIANKKPTAVPYPTGNTNSQPNSSIIGTKGIKKNELKADTKLAHTNEFVSSKGQNRAIAKLDPPMHIRIHFLQIPLFLCIGPINPTPMIPEIIGLPPTTDTAVAKFYENQGLSMKERVIDIPLKIPKKQPNAKNNFMQFQFVIIFLIESKKGSLLIFSASEGGVGGLFLWKIILAPQKTYPMMACSNIKSNVNFLPSSQLFPSSFFNGLYPPKTTVGMITPMISDTLRTNVNICVILPLWTLVNQLADIFPWQLRIKGRPIPANTWPTITHANDSLTSNLRLTPMIPSIDPTMIPVLDPYVSITKAAGNVNMGCMSTNSRPPKLTTVED